MAAGTALLVGIHLAVALWHGRAHAALAIDLPPHKDAFVLVVIVLSPLVAGTLVWTSFARGGLRLFAAAMTAAFVFGVYHHYVLVSPDHVAHLPDGAPAAQSAFVLSAAALAVVELTGALCGGYWLLSNHRGRAMPGQGRQS